ncbi:putative membrane-anchored protein [Duganella sp. 3397]|uniref:GDYXXLXY domain-containing protein n=1 Tax=Duganella sp. 3397 TaxID=2817732 RepID=UPI00285A1E58|nr:GDYXXLXY domain-containing protein [Duganella sp. 3397]MDR7052642.1 putative membrane-anchored protein [Duganella sp. 3397]
MSRPLQHLIEAATAEGLLSPNPKPEEAARPWPVILMTALGAWLAAVPLLFALAAIFGDALEKGVLCYVLGAAFLVCAVRVLRSRTVSPFVEQLGLPVLLVGGALLVFGLFRDLPYFAAEALLLLVITGTAWLVPQHWLRVLLGALAALVFVLMNANLKSASPLHLASGALLALVAWLIAAWYGDAHAPSHRAAHKMIVLETMSNGWLLLTLAALVYDSGTTFLSPVAWGHAPGAGDAMGFSTSLFPVISSVMAVAAASWLARCWPALRAPRYAAAAAILAIMSWLIPGLGAALLALSACVGSGRWRLAVASGVAAAWIIGTFYYELAVPLATKAAIMAGMGAAFGVIAWLSWNAGARAVTGDVSGATVPSADHGADVATSPVQRAGLFATLLLILVVANGAIWQKEALISSGRPVFIALAPVDPRSLMQGDYMALNFELPAVNDIRTMRRAKVVAKVDPRGVAVMQGLATGKPLAADEIVIELVSTGRGLRPATDAWYFKEGEAERWSHAKYGEFRIDGNGRALLVNLRGAELEPL